MILKMAKHLLELRNISKKFPGVKALDHVDLTLDEGQVLALAGENGAGKSTLMLTLGGVYQPDEGEILIAGEKVVFQSPLEAQRSGVGIVYQELSLILELSIAENIFANRQPVNKLGFIKKDKIYQDTKEMLKLFNMEHLDPSMLVKDLSIANRQVVEILKAMSCNPKVLVMDEPTSSLTDVEVNELFKNIKILKEQGIGIIYISHHLNEIFELADEVLILRDGKYICDAKVADIDEDFLVTNMVGRKIENIYGTPRIPASGEVIFEARSITKKGLFEKVSFTVKKGEIVGMSGLVGAGRTEIGRAIFGAEPIDEGVLLLDGKPITVSTPEQAIRLGIGYMSEDRKEQGLYQDFDMKANIAANRLVEFSHNGFMNEKQIEVVAKGMVKQFGVAIPNIYHKIGKLSGGNQQKVLLAAWIGIVPKLLIIDEPTRGVDVGAKSEIYSFIKDLASQGVAVLMISSDLPEILGVSDRILVVKEGEIVGNCSTKESSEESIISMATGIGKRGTAR